MKKIIAFTMLLLLLGLNQATFAQSNQKSKKAKSTSQLVEHRIVMQLTSSEIPVQKGLIKQLNNLKNGWGDTVLIEVVCHGPGIDFLNIEKTKFKDEIFQLKGKGIVFVVCENSLKEREVPKEAILPNMEYVKMGIAEIVIKQEQGWSYIKAGF